MIGGADAREATLNTDQAISAGTYTVMFTDMVGSTSTRVSLGEAPADELRRVHDALLFAAIEDNAGRVVKTAGDGVMAAFRACHEAIDAAVEIQQAVERYGRRSDAIAPIRVRVGLSVGDVSVEDGDLFGTPVVEAARLESIAAPGSILCSELVRVLSGGRSDAQFIDRGEIELKGFPEPIRHCEIGWSTGEASSAPVPLPLHLTSTWDWPMVGREEEIDLLTSAWKSARADQPTSSIVFLAGEPGIGKTRLSTDFAQQVHADGGIVLFGRCSEGFADPYQPFVEALRPTGVVELIRKAMDQADIESLQQLLPELAGGSRQNPLSEADRPRLFRSVVTTLERLAETNGVLLILDDLQWAEASALVLLRRLCDDSITSRLVIVGTYREHDAIRGEPLANLIADLQRNERFDRIKLRGLIDADVVELARARGATDLDDAAVQLIHSIRHEANGSPLYVTEMFRSLAETGAIAMEEGRWVATAELSEIELPETVRNLIDRRVARLPSEVVETLTFAAVIGQQFDLSVLAELRASDVDSTLDHLERAVEARLVAESGASGEFLFAHALVQRSLYESLSTTRRGRLHDRVREVLSTRADSVREQAHHAYLAHTSVDAAGTAQLLLESGQADEAALAWEAGAEKYRRGLDVLDPRANDAGLRAALHLGMARTLRRSESADPRPHLDAGTAAARESGRPDLLAEFAIATLRPGWWFPEAGVVDDAHVALCEEALDAVPNDHPLRVMLLGTLASALSFDPDRSRRIALLDEASSIASSADDPRLEHAHLSHRWVAIWDPASAFDRLSLAERLASISSELGIVEGEAQAAICRLHCLIELGRVNDVLHRLDEADAVLERAQIPYFTWIVRMMRDLLAVLEDGEAVEDQLAETLALAGGSHADAEKAYAAGLFGLYYARRAIGELEPFLELQVAQQPEFVVWRAGWAASLAALGRLDEAKAIYDDFIDGSVELPMNFVWTTGMNALVDVAESLADAAGARHLYRKLLPYAGRLDSTAGVTSLGPIDLALARAAAISGNVDAAETHALAARDLAQAFNARHYLAWADRLLDELPT